jgi:hypothetical protein
MTFCVRETVSTTATSSVHSLINLSLLVGFTGITKRVN